jgi:hypothetical protein
MPAKVASKVKFAVGDEVTFEMNDDTVTGTVKKMKGANYMVEDGEGTVYECEPSELTAVEEETPAPKKKKAAVEEEEEETPAPKKKKAAAEEEEEEEAPKKKGAKPAAKGSTGWNSMKPAEESKGGGLPIGDWEALAYTGLAEEGEKGLSAYIEYVGVHDDDVNGKTQRAYYNLKDADGEWSEGATYFKRDLLILGFEEEQLELSDEDDNDAIIEEFNKLLKKLRKMEPWVSIKVKPAKKAGYTTLYLGGLMDDQEDKPENPLSK